MGDGRHEGPKAPMTPWEPAPIEPPSPDGNTPQGSGQHRRDEEDDDE